MNALHWYTARLTIRAGDQYLRYLTYLARQQDKKGGHVLDSTEASRAKPKGDNPSTPRPTTGKDEPVLEAPGPDEKFEPDVCKTEGSPEGWQPSYP